MSFRGGWGKEGSGEELGPAKSGRVGAVIGITALALGSIRKVLWEDMLKAKGFLGRKGLPGILTSGAGVVLVLSPHTGPIDSIGGMGSLGV